MSLKEQLFDTAKRFVRPAVAAGGIGAALLAPDINYNHPIPTGVYLDINSLQNHDPYILIWNPNNTSEPILVDSPFKDRFSDTSPLRYFDNEITIENFDERFDEVYNYFQSGSKQNDNTQTFAFFNLNKQLTQITIERGEKIGKTNGLPGQIITPEGKPIFRQIKFTYPPDGENELIYSYYYKVIGPDATRFTTNYHKSNEAEMDISDPVSLSMKELKNAIEKLEYYKQLYIQNEIRNNGKYLSV